jgi:hypothetical protein
MTGVFAGAPVAASVIPVFTLITAGRDPVLRVLRGFLSGQMGFAVFFLIFAAAMPQWRAWALLPALLGGVVVGFAGAALIRWRLTARPRLVGTQS